MPKLIGTAWDDLLEAPDGQDWTIYGLAGDDFLYGLDGNDKILGGSGDEDMNGGAGDDFLRGGAGYDWLRGDEGNDRLNGDGGDDVISGGPGDDIVIGAAGNDSLYGREGDDTLFGGLGNDWLDDLDGINTISGGAGDDTIQFASGTASGGEGNDILRSYGSAAGGASTQTGDGGSDWFRFEAHYDGLGGASHVEITDFTKGQDKLGLSLALYTPDGAAAGHYGMVSVFAILDSNGDGTLDGTDINGPNLRAYVDEGDLVLAWREDAFRIDDVTSISRSDWISG